MKKNLSFLYALILSGALMILSQPLQAWDWSGCESNRCENDWCGMDWFSDIRAEARIAYYHPSSSKVRHIYGDGWPDYQLEISKGIGCNWRLWAGVSGFSRKGESIGCHDDTKLELIPINLGVKYYYPIWCNLNLFVGGAACYSFLRIHDHSKYVHEHTSKENWGGLIQSGLSYTFCNCGIVSVFADYFFQRFHFRDSHCSCNSCYSYYDHADHFVERHSLDMSGFKVGIGLGITF